MKKFKNKFIIGVIILIVFIIGIEFYRFFSISKDTNSYVSLKVGKGFLNNQILKINKPKKIVQGDVIKTIGKDSLAVIKWGDGSITRLGGNSILKVKNNFVSKDLDKIQIHFSLLAGKSWSDVIRFVGGESYFYEDFADTTAAVRGTIFEVNLDKNYLFVRHNEVELKKQNKTKIVGEKQAFDIKKFSFIDLIEFIQKYKDKAWESLNKKLDKELYDKLLKQVQKLNILTSQKIDDLQKLSQEQKQKLYKEIKKQYQLLNFVGPNSDLFLTKLELKKYLIKLSDSPKEKKDLLKTSVYDLKDVLNSKQYKKLFEIINILGENAYDLKKLNIDFSKYFNQNLLKNIEIPEGLEDSFKNNFNKILQNINLNNNLNPDEINFKIVEYQELLKDNLKNSSFGQKLKEFLLNLVN